MITATVLADSMSPDAVRLTTLEVTFPRFILAEFNTHRAFSRNSASSRAIPVEKMLDRVMMDPFVPEAFPVNRSGMSAGEYIGEDDPRYGPAEAEWLWARDSAVKHVMSLVDSNVHKQIANRILEPFMWHTVIVSSTDWDNFFDLRISEHAQPEIRQTAEHMRDAMRRHSPMHMDYGEWHLPLLSGEEDRQPLDQQIRSSVARCAAVSYNRHHVKDYDKENRRYELLAGNGHLSPFEHVATPSGNPVEWANFRGWTQARWYAESGVDISGVTRA